MKAERITVGKVYMAVVGRREVRVLVQAVKLDQVLGKNLETNGGIAMSVEKIVAGPLKDGATLPQ